MLLMTNAGELSALSPRNSLPPSILRVCMITRFGPVLALLHSICVGEVDQMTVAGPSIIDMCVSPVVYCFRVQLADFETIGIVRTTYIAGSSSHSTARAATSIAVCRRVRCPWAMKLGHDRECAVRSVMVV